MDFIVARRGYDFDGSSDGQGVRMDGWIIDMGWVWGVYLWRGRLSLCKKI